MLAVQPPCVALIFPHASAETSNTGSNLRVGVLYGFFPVAVAGVFSLALFSVFNGSSKVQYRWPHFAVVAGEERCPTLAAPLSHANIKRAMVQTAQLCEDMMLQALTL